MHAAVKTEHQKLDAFELEACRSPDLRAFLALVGGAIQKNTCRAAWRRVPLAPFVVSAFQAAVGMPPASLVAHVCMVHVLTDVRSSRARRLWSASQFLRSSATERSSRRLLIVLE